VAEKRVLMAHISERKVTIYLPAKVQRKLIAQAQRNKLKNLRKGMKREYKLPETMGAIVREALEEYFQKLEETKSKAGKEVGA
jgi:membrane-associated HD superfamily phosphohydrolase